MSSHHGVGAGGVPQDPLSDGSLRPHGRTEVGPALGTQTSSPRSRRAAFPSALASLSLPWLALMNLFVFTFV